MGSYLVYGLIDPRSGELRYVGKSVTGLRRPNQHAQEWRLRKDGRTRKANWLRQLLAAGLKPEVEVLEECAAPELLDESERHFIAYFRAIGCNLANLTDGGDGALGYHHSDSAKRKLAALRLGRLLGPQSSEHRARRSASMMGLNPSKPVVDENGVMYRGVKEAAKACGVSAGSVSQSARKGYRAGAHRFKYVEAACQL